MFSKTTGHTTKIYLEATMASFLTEIHPYQRRFVENLSFSTSTPKLLSDAALKSNQLVFVVATSH
jgi:hypothetical protein